MLVGGYDIMSQFIPILNFRAPLNLLSQIHEMRSVRHETPVVITALATLERHLNFLSPELVIFALFDLSVPAEERQRMSPLGVAERKIEFAANDDLLPQTVTQRMSPLEKHNGKLKLHTFVGRCPQR